MSQSLEVLAWIGSILLMAAGLVGAVFPVIPDSLLILAGAFLQHFTVQSTHKVGWWTLGLMTVLSILAHIVDFAAGMMGAKKFGASRWGGLWRNCRRDRGPVVFPGRHFCRAGRRGPLC